MSAFVLALALLGAAPAWAGSDSREPPYACRLLRDEQRKCPFDPHCDKWVIERLTKECLRDGGRP